MILKNTEDILLSDFQNLVDNSVPEGRSLEYKRELVLRTEADKKEFLADVSSFANASGGDLIYGISEDRNTGLPLQLEGIKLHNDETVLRLEALIRDGLVPRINGIEIRTVDIDTDRKLLLIRIPKSWNLPHQVIIGGSNRFFGRAANGKYLLDIDELRSAFLLTEETKKRIKNFITERLAMISSGEDPMPLLPNGKIILHLVPISSFHSNRIYDLQQNHSPLRNIRPLNGGSRTPRFNLDGLITSSMSIIKEKYYNNYAQIFRNGIIETVNADLLEGINNEKYIRASGSMNYEYHVIDSIMEYLQVYRKENIELPVFIFLSFMDVKGYKLTAENVRPPFSNFSGIQKNLITLPEVTVSSSEENIAILLRPVFDIVWNACGYPRSFNYSEDGQWKPVYW